MHPVDLKGMKEQWIAARERAESLFARLPADDLGCLYLDPAAPARDPRSGRSGFPRTHPPQGQRRRGLAQHLLRSESRVATRPVPAPTRESARGGPDRRAGAPPRPAGPASVSISVHPCRSVVQELRPARPRSASLPAPISAGPDRAGGGAAGVRGPRPSRSLLRSGGPLERSSGPAAVQLPAPSPRTAGPAALPVPAGRAQERIPVPPRRSGGFELFRVRPVKYIYKAARLPAMILPAGPVVPSGRSRHASKPHRRSTLECPPQRFPPQWPDSSRVLPPPPDLTSLLPKASLPAPPVPARPQRRSSLRRCRPPFPPGHHPARSHPVDHGLPTPPRAHPFQWMSNRRRARIRPPDPPPSHRRRGGSPMFGPSAAVRVYLATNPADMRKGFDGAS